MDKEDDLNWILLKDFTFLPIPTNQEIKDAFVRFNKGNLVVLDSDSMDIYKA